MVCAGGRVRRLTTGTLLQDAEIREGARAVPLLRWPGGKRHLVSTLRCHLPERFDTYHEPFAGGAALFFAIRPKSAILSDSNRDLIDCYSAVRDDPNAVIAAGQTLENSAEAYYRIRATHPTCRFERAARFLFLNRLAFNGIYRVNLRGEFNVPYGHKSHLSALDVSAIRDAAEALSETHLICRGFQHVSIFAVAGDLVYFDPPYTLAHANNGFIKYN